jgi:hypothetical protein
MVFGESEFLAWTQPILCRISTVKNFHFLMGKCSQLINYFWLVDFQFLTELKLDEKLGVSYVGQGECCQINSSLKGSSKGKLIVNFVWKLDFKRKFFNESQIFKDIWQSQSPNQSIQKLKKEKINYVELYKKKTEMNT